MTEIITSEWLMPSIAIAALTVAILAWLNPKNRGTVDIDPKELPKPYRTTETPKIRATSGTPSLQQLTAGIELNAKAKGLAEDLYKLGLEQYDHPVNNRDGTIDSAHREMGRLAGGISHEERKLAEQIGVALVLQSQIKGG